MFDFIVWKMKTSREKGLSHDDIHSVAPKPMGSATMQFCIPGGVLQTWVEIVAPALARAE